MISLYKCLFLSLKASVHYHTSIIYLWSLTNLWKGSLQRHTLFFSTFPLIRPVCYCGSLRDDSQSVSQESRFCEERIVESKVKFGERNACQSLLCWTTGKGSLVLAKRLGWSAVEIVMPIWRIPATTQLLWCFTAKLLLESKLVGILSIMLPDTQDNNYEPVRCKKNTDGTQTLPVGLLKGPCPVMDKTVNHEVMLQVGEVLPLTPKEKLRVTFIRTHNTQSSTWNTGFLCICTTDNATLWVFSTLPPLWKPRGCEVMGACSLSDK